MDIVKKKKIVVVNVLKTLITDRFNNSLYVTHHGSNIWGW